MENESPEYIKLYEQVHDNLIEMFEIDHSSDNRYYYLDKYTPIMSNEKIIYVLTQSYKFWESKKPQININNIKNESLKQLLLIKLDICDMKISAILDEAKRLGFYEKLLVNIPH